MKNNPLIEETPMVKIKSKFKRKEQSHTTSSKAVAHIIGMNEAIPICAEACACCWDRPVPIKYEAKATYVAKRARIGHTSVLEHSNYVVYVSVDASLEEELIEFLDWCHYVNTKAVKSSDGSRWHLIVGGSFRAFSDIYRETDDLNNTVLKAITGNLYTYANSAAFEDICELKLLDRSMFNNIIEPDENCCLLTDMNAKGFETDRFKIIGVDSIEKLYNNLYRVDEDAASKITTYDLIKFVSVTILFKNMSRIITQQLVRHRNGITQESQRYVDYSGACFNSPDLFRPDKYDPDHKYNIEFGDSKFDLTLSELGDALCGIYSNLTDPNKVGVENTLLKEDARGYLPLNVQSRKVFMTFTYKSLFKFLDLREDQSAQAEIRSYAQEIGNVFRENTKFNTKEIMNLYTQPRLLVSDPFSIDIDMGESEEVVELTENDYIAAAGLDVNDGSSEEVISDYSNLKNGDEV